MSTSTVPRSRPARPPRARRATAALVATAVVCVLFLALELPAYVGLDPERSRTPVRPDYALHYPLLVGHILFGSVALLAGCLQMWPTVRRRWPAVHRWSGRAYVFGGVLPGGLLVLGIAPLSTTGFVSAVGNTALGVLWLATTTAGWRAARAGRVADHRAWMVRSMALTLSIVANRVWLVGLLVLTATVPGLVGSRDPAAVVTAVAGASVWLSWVVNLLVAEWWFLGRRRAAGPTPVSAGDTGAT